MSDINQNQSRLMRIALIVSLALNLCVIGAIAGFALSGGGSERMQRFDLTVGPLTRALDPDRRAAIRDDLRTRGVFGPDNRQAMRRDLVSLIDVLRSDQFDSAAFGIILERQRDRLQASQLVVVDAITAQISGMSDEDRAAFADRLEDQFRRGTVPPQRGN